ncbi:LysR family transcriptional regulator [Uliginosibacterium gangwonense]|uniref:LysR family transcriptional regulator n=1 Tax=Uliginosibacterium gangwonense TaxID=392736 RepID=UPI00036A820A|nr:LysR family transcriptional regulator [Uliginosibacterium gangwonense]
MPNTVNTRIDIFRALKAFVEAAELGSFHQVATAQGISPQAVSKSIRQLEQHLGVRLFHRTTHKNSLTDEGERLYETTRLHLGELTGALGRIQQVATDDEGTIRITAPPALGRRLLVPLIAEYQDTHPGIEVELLFEERFTDLVASRVDVGFRAGTAPEGQLVSRQLFPLQLITCAAPAYLQRSGWPTTPDQLWQHRCTGFRHPDTGRLFPWEFLMDGEIVYRDIPAIFCTNDGETEFCAVLEGIAIGLLDSVSAAPVLREGRLVPLLCEHVSPRMGLHIYYPPRSNMPRRIGRFIDFAMARLSQRRDCQLSIDELRTLHQAGTQGIKPTGRHFLS